MSVLTDTSRSARSQRFHQLLSPQSPRQLSANQIRSDDNADQLSAKRVFRWWWIDQLDFRAETAGGAVQTSSTDTWSRTRNQSLLRAKEKKKNECTTQAFLSIFTQLYSDSLFVVVVTTSKFYHYFMLWLDVGVFSAKVTKYHFEIIQ